MPLSLLQKVFRLVTSATAIKLKPVPYLQPRKAGAPKLRLGNSQIAPSYEVSGNHTKHPIHKYASKVVRTQWTEGTKRVLYLTLKSTDPKKRFDVRDVQAYVGDLSFDWKNEGVLGSYQVLLKGSNGRPAGTPFIPIGEYRSLKDYLSELRNEYEDVIQDIKKVFIFIKKEMAGGCDDEYNDCLWDCIAESVVRTRWGTGQCKDAAAMKSYLKLPRKAMVPVAMIPAIEKNMDTGPPCLHGSRSTSTKLNSANGRPCTNRHLNPAQAL